MWDTKEVIMNKDKPNSSDLIKLMMGNSFFTLYHLLRLLRRLYFEILSHALNNPNAPIMFLSFMFDTKDEPNPEYFSYLELGSVKA